MPQSKPVKLQIRRRIFSSGRKRLRYIDEVLTLIGSGLSIKSACVTDKRFPSPSQFGYQIRSDPHLRKRYEAVARHAGQGVANLAALEHAETIIRRVESGETLKAACASDPRFPPPLMLVRALKYKPDLELRYDLEMIRRGRPHAKARAAFDEIERRIRAGGRILDDLGSDRRRFPGYTAFLRLLKADPEIDARYRAAGRAREAGPARRGKGPDYSLSELRQAATALMLSNSRQEIRGQRMSPDGPHLKTLLDARHRDPALLVAVESAIVARRARLHIFKGRPKIHPANVRLVKPTTSMVRGPIQTGERHAATLASNELWRRAVAALPPGLDQAARDDMAASIVLAILEGQIDISTIAVEARRLMKVHNSERFARNVSSIDAPLVSGSTFSLADVLSNNWD